MSKNFSKKEDLYVLVESDNYRTSKSEILESQADLLRIMKHIQNLKFLSRQKLDLQTHLHTLFEMLVGEVNLMEKNLPKPLIPKAIYGIHEPLDLNLVHEELPNETTKPIQKGYSRQDEIDTELQSIKEKLKILNS